jgi:hypothetical protein
MAVEPAAVKQGVLSKVQTSKTPSEAQQWAQCYKTLVEAEVLTVSTERRSPAVRPRLTGD